MSSTAGQRYLDLLKRSVNQYLYLGGEEALADYYVDAAERYEHFTWKVPRPCQPHTVLHRSQLDLLEELLVRLHEQGVPGDVLEAGVWRGGAIVLMRAVVEVYGMDRTVIAADSFAGIPPNESITGDPVDAWPDWWAASLDEVKATICRYGLLDERIHFICGRFKETLPSAAIERLALIRLDADSYDSTSQALEALYPKLTPGGIVIVDDWHLPGSTVAVMEYRSRNRITSPLVQAAMNVYWTKE